MSKRNWYFTTNTITLFSNFICLTKLFCYAWSYLFLWNVKGAFGLKKATVQLMRKCVFICFNFSYMLTVTNRVTAISSPGWLEWISRHTTHNITLSALYSVVNSKPLNCEGWTYSTQQGISPCQRIQLGRCCCGRCILLHQRPLCSRWSGMSPQLVYHFWSVHIEPTFQKLQAERGKSSQNTRVSG